MEITRREDGIGTTGRATEHVTDATKHWNNTVEAWTHDKGGGWGYKTKARGEVDTNESGTLVGRHAAADARSALHRRWSNKAVGWRVPGLVKVELNFHQAGAPLNAVADRKKKNCSSPAINRTGMCKEL